MRTPAPELRHHATVPGRSLLLALAVLTVAGCAGMDTAAMVGPGASPVTADVGELRVLRHRDDPPAGDRWVDVLDADTSVFARTGSFREEGSRTAAAHEAADVRLLYEARGPGRTLVVRMDCQGCGSDGVPTSRPGDTRVLVWELVAGGVRETQLGPSALSAGQVTDVTVGDHVVVVEPGGTREVLPDDAVLRFVATHDDPRVDVYAVVAEGTGAAAYGAGAPSYPVRARER